MNSETKEVVVLGGGISGLTVGWQLKKAGVNVSLLEKGDKVGGCMRTQRRDGFLLERGPFNVIVRDPSFESLLEDLTDDVRVVSASDDARSRYIFRNKQLHTVPTNPISMLTTKMLSLSGRLRLMRGLLLSRRGSDREETIEQVATRRIGAEATDALVSAVISGIFSGDIAKLSLPACFPSVATIDRDASSLIGYAVRTALGRKRKKQRQPRWRGMVSLDGGLGALSRAMGARLGNDCVTGAMVRSIVHDSGGFTIAFERDGETHALHANKIVLAVPAHEAERLLEPINPQAARQIAPIQSTSLAVMNLAYRRQDVGHPLRGFGFLVPRNEPTYPLMGVLWADSIFPHHAPGDQRLLRVFIGGARDPQAITLNDDELVARAQSGLRNLLSIRGEPTFVDIVRHAPAIPQYHVGHRKRISRFREEIDKLPGLFIAGNYLDGVSLNDCVRVGARCAERVISETRKNAASGQHVAAQPCLSS